MSSSTPTYSVVVPVFNSAESLKELAQRLPSVFSHENQLLELILVDDGSDNPETWRTIQHLTESHSGITGVKLTRNFGRQGALACGLELSKGDYVVIMDDDLQHRPEDISAFFEHGSHDVVIARFKKKAHGPIKILVSAVNDKIERMVLKKPAGLKDSSFKMMKRDIVDHVCALKSSHPFLFARLCFVTRDMINVDLDHSQRKYGKSGFTIGKMWQSFSNLIFNNSSLLLRAIAIIGLCASLISFGYGAFVLVQKLRGEIKVTGWASTIITVVTFGGLLLFSVGILGEYLIRIIRGTEHKPAYLVKTKTDNKDE